MQVCISCESQVAPHKFYCSIKCQRQEFTNQIQNAAPFPRFLNRKVRESTRKLQILPIDTHNDVECTKTDSGVHLEGEESEEKQRFAVFHFAD